MECDLPSGCALQYRTHVRSKLLCFEVVSALQQLYVRPGDVDAEDGAMCASWFQIIKWVRLEQEHMGEILWQYFNIVAWFGIFLTFALPVPFAWMLFGATATRAPEQGPRAVNVALAKNDGVRTITGHGEKWRIEYNYGRFELARENDEEIS